MKNKHRMFIMVVAFVMAIAMAMPAFATTDATPQETIAAVSEEVTHEAVDDANTATGQIAQPEVISSLPYTDSYLVGNTRVNGVDYSHNVRIFQHNTGWRGPITINIVDFVPNDYVVKLQVYGKNGLLEDSQDWMGTTGNYKVLNAAGEKSITAVYMIISPRPKLFFQADPRQFEVRVSW